jgi:hypothetical protein
VSKNRGSSQGTKNMGSSQRTIDRGKDQDTMTWGMSQGAQEQCRAWWSQVAQKLGRSQDDQE